MGPQSHLIKLPVINFSKENLRPGTSKWLATCTDVRRAMEEFGCFEASYRKVPLDLHDTVLATTAELFDLPTEVKMRNQSDKPYFSYYGQYSFLPLYESLGIDNPTTIEGSQSFTHIMWPEGNDCFSQTVQSFSQLVAELDGVVMKMLCESYGVGSHYDSYVEKTNYLLRFFKYRVAEKDETTMGLTPHSDKTMLSIIHANHVNGLQARTKDGQWIDVEIPPTSYIVMAGDALMAWSNDRIPTCYHQVIMTEKETRYSTGMFSFITGMIHIPEELADESHPPRYKSFDHFSFLHFNQEEGKKFPCSIKAYCGI